jgi:oxygen-dependent protoporphyrinogen oxidase
VGAFVRRRFGRATLAELVDPLLAGTRAGDADDMSLAAALPQIDSLARRHRSVIRGLRDARRRGALEPGPPPFLTVRGGLGRLVDHLVRDLRGRAELRSATPVVRVNAGDAGFVIHLAGGGRRPASGVVLAVPAHRASGLLQDTSPAAAAALAAIAHASVAAATLVYPPGTFDPPAGTSGMLVAGSGGRTLSACSWFSTKWPHAAPGGETVIRGFVGRSGRHPALDLDDERLTARLATDLRDALGIAAPPRRASVTRWENGLPQYAVGHLERVGRIEAGLAHWPRLALAGASYRGSGLVDCIRQGRAAADRVAPGRPLK